MLTSLELLRLSFLVLEKPPVCRDMSTTVDGRLGTYLIRIAPDVSDFLSIGKCNVFVRDNYVFVIFHAYSTPVDELISPGP